MLYVIKADVDRSKLTPQLRPVKGKTKTFMSIRYLAPGETKKQLKEYIETRPYESKYTKYMQHHTDMVNVLTQDLLKKQVSKTKSGKQYYQGVDVDNIAIVFEFKDPNAAFGCVRITEKVDGTSPKRDYTDKRVEKRHKTKHKRAKNVGRNIAEITKAYHAAMLKPDGSAKMQVATCVALIAQHSIRVGTEGGGVPDHYGTTTLEARHFNDLKSDAEANDLQHRISDELNKPLNVLQAKIKEEKDESKKEKMGKRFDSMRNKIIERYGWLRDPETKPKVGESWLFFIGKSGVPWIVKLRDKAIIDAIKSSIGGAYKPDQRIFANVQRRDVAKFLGKYRVVPKDFRDWNSTKKFVEEAIKIAPADFPTKEKDIIALENEIVDRCSMMLWNQRGVCKKTYLDPEVLQNFRAGLLTKKTGETLLTKSEKYIILT